MSGNPRIGFPFSPHQTISFLTSGPWPTILVLAGYRLVVPRPCAYFTSFVCWKLVYCSCVCHGLKAHLCILPLILDLLWRELFFDLSFFIGLLLSRAEPCLIVGFSPFSPFFALSIVLFSFLPYHSIIPVIVLFDSCLLGLLGLLPILLSMTQYGHWIYTHATLGFLNPLHFSWTPLSHHSCIGWVQASSAWALRVLHFLCTLKVCLLLMRLSWSESSSVHSTAHPWPLMAWTVL